MWLGLLLVVVGMLVGAKVVSGADSSVSVWRVTHDVRLGMPVGKADLSVTAVHFGDAATRGRYVLVTGTPPAGRASRDLHAGDLLDRAALTNRARSDLRQLPLGVASADVPADLASGDRVDVWAVPDPEQRAGSTGHARLVLRSARVLSVDGGEDVTSTGDRRQVLVAVGSGTPLQAVLDAVVGAEVVLVRQGVS